MNRTAAWGCRLAVLVLLLMVPCAPSYGAVPIADSYSEANENIYWSLTDLHPSADGDDSAAGQTFNMTLPTATLDYVQFWLKKTGAPVAEVTAKIYTHTGNYGSTGTPTGAALASSSAYQVSALSTVNYQLITFTFSGANRITLTEGVKYVLVLEVTQKTTLSGAAYIMVARDSSTPSHPGNSVYYDNSAWSASSGNDSIFYVYVTRPSSWSNFYFDDAVYENNTDAGSVTVTAVIPSGSEDFTVDGADWWGDPDMPASFHWSIGAATRVIWVVGEENFTVTLPDDDYGSYGLTVKDYTAKLGLGTAYLESYRSIGGNEVLTQRAKITVGAATPLTLVVYKLYHLQVLWADGTRYDAGYYTPGVDTSTDIYVFGVAFSDQAQVTYKYLTIEALRPSPTQITVNYQDTLNQTNWCNVTIMTMDRTTVHQAQGSGGTLQFNWLSAEAGVDYTVYVVVDHSFFTWYPSGEWVLQGAYTFPAFIPMVGSVGGVTVTSIVGWFMVAVSATAFSKRDAELGLWAGVITASLMWMVAGWFGAAELGIVASFAVAYTILKRSGVL